ncbi:hypothetical protein C1646_758955 [Rhizophagus diaphanus]|nr:hypothetical protein C1646_758955 [Rhizophagus diaphanus] [Rhizophagus sp. MUCL 43196]
MAQILLNRTLSYSKNFSITKNQSTLLIKSSQIIYKPIIIRSIQSCSCQTPNHTNHMNHTKLTKTVSEDYVNESYDSGGKILRDFINTIEIKIYENNARLIGEPITIEFCNDNDRCGEFNQFHFNGKYVISVFGKDIKEYFISHFPNSKITFAESIYTNSITITNYLNRDIILKKAGIGICDY